MAKESSKEQQLNDVVNKLNVLNLDNIYLERMADATALVIILSNLAQNLSQSLQNLPPERRATIEGKIRVAIEHALSEVVKKEQEFVAEKTKEEEKIRKINDEEEIGPLIDYFKYPELANPNLSEEDKAIIQSLADDDDDLGEFFDLHDILQIPTIKDSFTSLAEKAKIVSSVFTNPLETIAYLKRDIEINSIHQLITNHTEIKGHAKTELTKSMLDNFRDTDKNKKFVNQQKQFLEGLQQQEQTEEIKRMGQEIKETMQVANTAIDKEEAVEEVKEIKKEVEANLPELLSKIEQRLQPVMLDAQGRALDSGDHDMTDWALLILQQLKDKKNAVTPKETPLESSVDKSEVSAPVSEEILDNIETLFKSETQSGVDTPKQPQSLRELFAKAEEEMKKQGLDPNDMLPGIASLLLRKNIEVKEHSSSTWLERVERKENGLEKGNTGPANPQR